jgi:hypothetical protein
MTGPSAVQRLPLLRQAQGAIIHPGRRGCHRGSRWRCHVRCAPPPAPGDRRYAFDLLELTGEDLRPLPLAKRKAKLARLLARASAGIELNEHIDDDGAAVFRQACRLGLEGIVSKRLTAPYRSGPSRDWIKVMNPDSPAMRRARAGLAVGGQYGGQTCIKYARCRRRSYSRGRLDRLLRLDRNRGLLLRPWIAASRLWPGSRRCRGPLAQSGVSIVSSLRRRQAALRALQLHRLPRARPYWTVMAPIWIGAPAPAAEVLFSAIEFSAH